MVFGESRTTHARSSRKWYLGNEEVEEADEVHHLGILRMFSLSTISRTTEQSTIGRSAFFALNSVGSRFGCLHPVTSHRLYSTLCLPIMLYGSELWSLTNTDLNILERTHRKILRAIQGLPTRCPTTALQSLIGSCSISSFISQRQLAFINSIINMQASDLPKQILEVRIANPNAKGITATWKDLVPTTIQIIAPKRILETLNQAPPRYSSLHLHATSMRELPPRWLRPPNRKTGPSPDNHPPRHLRHP